MPIDLDQPSTIAPSVSELAHYWRRGMNAIRATMTYAVETGKPDAELAALAHSTHSAFVHIAGEFDSLFETSLTNPGAFTPAEHQLIDKFFRKLLVPAGQQIYNPLVMPDSGGVRDISVFGDVMRSLFHLLPDVKQFFMILGERLFIDGSRMHFVNATPKSFVPLQDKHFIALRDIFVSIASELPSFADNLIDVWFTGRRFSVIVNQENRSSELPERFLRNLMASSLPALALYEVHRGYGGTTLEIFPNRIPSEDAPIMGVEMLLGGNAPETTAAMIERYNDLAWLRPTVEFKPGSSDIIDLTNDPVFKAIEYSRTLTERLTRRAEKP